MQAKNRPLIRILQIVLALMILPTLVVAASLPVSRCEAKYVLNESLTINLNVEMTEPVEPTNPTWPVDPNDITVTDRQGNSMLFKKDQEVIVYIPLAGNRTWSRKGSLWGKSNSYTDEVKIVDNNGKDITVTITDDEGKVLVRITWPVLKNEEANGRTYVWNEGEPTVIDGVFHFKFSFSEPSQKPEPGHGPRSENLSEDRLTAQDSVSTIDETTSVSEAAEIVEAIPHTEETSTGESPPDIEKALSVETAPVAETSPAAETSQSTEAP